MSDAELKISLQLEEANRKLDVLAGKFNTAAGAGKNLADQNAKNSKTIGKNIDGLVTKVGALGAAYLTTAGATKAWNVAATSAKARDSIKIFEAAGGSIAELRKQTKGFVDDATLAKNANLARVMGISQEEFGRLANMARAAAKLTGESTEFMLESIVKGTARGSKLLLDNLGILVDVKKANKDYAKQLGVNVQQLTDEQKKRAFKLEVLRREKDLTEQVTKAGADQSDVYERAETAIKNLALTFGDLLGPTVGAAALAMQELALWMREVMNLTGDAGKPDALALQAQSRAATLAKARRIGSRIGLGMDASVADLRAAATTGKGVIGDDQSTKNAIKSLAETLAAYDKLNKQVGKMAISRHRGKPKRRGGGGGGGGSGSAADTMDGTAFVTGIFGGTLPSDALIADMEETDLFAGRRIKGAKEADFLETFKDRQNDILDAEAERIRAVAELEAAQDARREAEHQAQLDRLAEYQHHTTTALNIGVDLVMTGMQMFADQEEHILAKLTAMGLARVGNVLVGEGVLAASKGAALAIESFGADPRGFALMGQGAAMVAGGVAMGGASIGINTFVANMENGGDSVGTNATRVRTSNSRSTSSATSDGGINLTVVYNGAGPGADEQAKFAASLIQRARRMGVNV